MVRPLVAEAPRLFSAGDVRPRVCPDMIVYARECPAVRINKSEKISLLVRVPWHHIYSLTRTGQGHRLILEP